MFLYYVERSYMFRHRAAILIKTGTAAKSQPLHMQPPRTILVAFIHFINFNQLLILTNTFCKIIIVCNFSKERRTP